VIFDTGKTRIDVEPRTDDDLGVSSFSAYVLNSPYARPRGVDPEKFNEFLTPLQSLQIQDFIDDDPSSPASYGLDKPARLYLEAAGFTLDLLLGNPAEGGTRYAKLAGSPGVFTVSGVDPIINTTPFTLVDKFALILSIDTVDRFEVSGDGRILMAEIQGKGDEAVFTLDGKKTEDKPFRQFYQAVIGLLTDAEYSGEPSPNSQSPAAGGAVTIRYWLNTPPGREAAISLIPYNRDFYVLSQNGTAEFLISRTQVRTLFSSADSMVYADD
jgi:hypothetical protein